MDCADKYLVFKYKRSCFCFFVVLNELGLGLISLMSCACWFGCGENCAGEKKKSFCLSFLFYVA